MDKQDGAAAPDPRHRRNAPVASGTPAAGSNVILRPGGSSAEAPLPGDREEERRMPGYQGQGNRDPQAGRRRDARRAHGRDRLAEAHRTRLHLDAAQEDRAGDHQHPPRERQGTRLRRPVGRRPIIHSCRPALVGRRLCLGARRRPRQLRASLPCFHRVTARMCAQVRMCNAPARATSKKIGRASKGMSKHRGAAAHREWPLGGFPGRGVR
jgi:hypothetical protein